MSIFNLEKLTEKDFMMKKIPTSLIAMTKTMPMSLLAKMKQQNGFKDVSEP
jgi:hypothetical protein